MNNWIKTLRAICIWSALGTSGELRAQEEHIIEDQRTNSLLQNTTWGDTYVGKYTSGNGLVLTNQLSLTSVDAFVGFTGSASNNFAIVANTDSSWTVSSLQIGSASNANNTVFIGDGGMVKINGALSILGTTNGNSLTLGTDGTLDVNHDFNASMDGFVYGTQTTLKVGGDLSGLDQVEDRRTVSLYGKEASWIMGTNILTIGGSSSSNNVSIEDGASLSSQYLSIGAGGDENTLTFNSGATGTLENISIGIGGSFNTFVIDNSSLSISNLAIGGGSTISNEFVVEGGGIATISGDVSYSGNGNILKVDSGGHLVADADFSATNSSFKLMNGGKLEARKQLVMDEILDGGTVILEGQNALLTNSGTFEIGTAANGTDNSLIIQNGAVGTVADLRIGSTNSANVARIQDNGKLVIENSLWMSPEGYQSVEILEGGWLTFKSGLAWTGGGTMLWQPDGTLEVYGEMVVIEGWFVGTYLEEGALFLDYGRTLVLNGTNGLWDAGGYNFHIGDLTSGSRLIVTNGATVNVGSMALGDFPEGGHNNQVIIGGQQGSSNATINVSNDVLIAGAILSGNWQNGGYNNTIRVADGGQLNIGETLHNRNSQGTSGLIIESGATVTNKHYYQSEGAFVRFGLSQAGITNSGPGLIQTDVAEFENNANIQVVNIGLIDLDSYYTNVFVAANTLIVGGTTNATSADLRQLDTDTGSLIDVILMEDNQDIVAILNRTYLSDSTGFDYGSQMYLISEEIDRMARNGNAAAIAQLDILNQMSGARQRAELEQLYARSAPTFMHGQGILDGLSRIKTRATVSRRNAPAGPKGPHAEDQGLQGWANGYGSMGSFDDKNGYDMQIFGSVIGIDKSFGDLLLGVAGGQAGSNLETEDGDESDATTAYGIFYASYGTDEVFGDFMVGVGQMDIENTSGTSFDVTSDVDASQFSVYAGGGKEIQPPGSEYYLRTEIGMLVSQYDQDSYEEESSNAVGKEVDAFDRLSYRSNLGFSVITPKSYSSFDLEAIFRANWLHEFNADEETVGYSLIGSDLRSRFTMLAPDADIFELGLGMNARWLGGLQFNVDVDGQISENTSALLFSGSVLYEF